MTEQILHLQLRRLRRTLGLKQEDVARHMDMARTTIVGIEQGVRKIKIEELQRFATLYGVTVEELAALPVAVPTQTLDVAHLQAVTPDEARLISAYRANDTVQMLRMVTERISQSA